MLGLRGCSVVVHAKLDHCAPEFGLEGRGRVVGDHLTPVDDDDALCEVVRLFEILRGEEDGGAISDEPRIMFQSSLRLWRSSPVVGSSRKSTGG